MIIHKKEIKVSFSTIKLATLSLFVSIPKEKQNLSAVERQVSWLLWLSEQIETKRKGHLAKKSRKNISKQKRFCKLLNSIIKPIKKCHCSFKKMLFFCLFKKGKKSVLIKMINSFSLSLIWLFKYVIYHHYNSYFNVSLFETLALFSSNIGFVVIGRRRMDCASQRQKCSRESKGSCGICVYLFSQTGWLPMETQW